MRRKSATPQAEIDKALRAAKKANPGMAFTVQLMPDGSFLVVPMPDKIAAPEPKMAWEFSL